MMENSMDTEKVTLDLNRRFSVPISGYCRSVFAQTTSTSSRAATVQPDLEKRVASASTAERVKLQKQLTKVSTQAEELRAYEEKIHYLADQMIAIDLDDGVKVNYAKFEDVLAKIK